MNQRALLALGLGVVLAALVAFAAWGVRRTAGDGEVGEITVEGNLAEIDAFLVERARLGPIVDEVVDGTPRLVREPIPEEVALKLFPQLVLSKKAVIYDEHCYYRYKPNFERRIPFAERPEGEWFFATNGAGLREDDEIAGERPDLRVVVAGDSQTEGVCNNDETWPNLLEVALESAHPDRTIEVLNTGKAGYHFYNYLGVLEKFAHLAPDLFVMAVYGGNDFAESMILNHYFHRTARPVCPECDRDAMQKLSQETTSGFYTQALRQVQYFRHHPAERDAALQAALSVVAECDRICRAKGIGFQIVWLPPMVDAQPRYLGPLLDEALGAFEMQRADLEISNRLADEVLAFAKTRGIETVDFRALFARAERQLYWNRDHHLNIAGNYAVSAMLVPSIEARRAERNGQ